MTVQTFLKEYLPKTKFMQFEDLFIELFNKFNKYELDIVKKELCIMVTIVPFKIYINLYCMSKSRLEQSLNCIIQDLNKVDLDIVEKFAPYLDMSPGILSDFFYDFTKCIKRLPNDLVNQLQEELVFLKDIIPDGMNFNDECLYSSIDLPYFEFTLYFNFCDIDELEEQLLYWGILKNQIKSIMMLSKLKGE